MKNLWYITLENPRTNDRQPRKLRRACPLPWLSTPGLIVLMAIKRKNPTPLPVFAAPNFARV